ncbi:PRD domain-containing protein [Saccharibacillus sp. CPCC 101409]|uniref:PRD domain-containing protein n=1 Tax=Saccharibacillus sp. CPCC 101409 TaxID=3058041 RepID=UPI002671895F|nr:PRD domain-containing protein [Saccharibacillus sp. CPCC 101409]MDO3412149.1 PRD domain-containing protein [Saccharibacillus sp. CPCC 101409]
MKINRILNNNAVVVKEGNSEKIVMGGGIAFQKGKNDIIDPAKIEKVFVPRAEGDKFKELLSTVPETHIALGEAVISYAERQLNMTLSEHVHIALTDHLTFALERFAQNIRVHNKLLGEIRVLYPEEYKIGLWALERIEEQFGISFPPDEAGYIALHIHTAKIDGAHVAASLDKAAVLQEISDYMLGELGVETDKNGVSHHRLLIHLQFAISRFQENKPFHNLDPEMLRTIKKTYRKGFDTAQKGAAYAEEKYGITFPESESAYIALHLQRIIENI